MRLHTKITAATIMLIAGIGAGVAMQPTLFWSSHSVAISAPLESVFDQVSHLEKWKSWGHWVKADPAAKVSFVGASGGKGSVFQWEGGEAIGAGSVTINESVPGDRIELTVVSVKPVVTSNHVEFTFRSEGSQTRVEWILAGRRTFADKFKMTFQDEQENAVVRQLKQSVDELKRVVESNARP